MFRDYSKKITDENKGETVKEISFGEFAGYADKVDVIFESGKTIQFFMNRKTPYDEIDINYKKIN